MAETYHPDTYVAVIWSDHYRFYGNQGTVHALQARENGDVVELWAQLQPGFGLIELNKERQKLFFSIEPTVNFADTGKTYLTGLACTDEPASLGTSQLQLFSKHSNKDAKNFFSTNCTVPVLAPEQPAQDNMQEDEREAFNLFKIIFNKLKGSTASFTGEPANEPDVTPDTGDDDEMTDEQFTKFTETVSGTLEKAVGDGFSRLEQKFSAGSGDEGGKDSGGDDKGAPDATQFAELKDGVEKLTEGFGKMQERMEQSGQFTKTPEATGGKSGQNRVY